jgi:hypothetical protein
MLYRDTLTAAVWIEFLERLIREAARKVGGLDNLRMCHSRKVPAWLADRTGKIALSFLPTYLSELNLDESLDADLSIPGG